MITCSCPAIDLSRLRRRSEVECHAVRSTLRPIPLGPLAVPWSVTAVADRFDSLSVGSQWTGRREARVMRVNSQTLTIGDPIVRPRDAAEYLGIGRSSLYRLIDSGDLPKPLRLTPQASGWRLSTLEEFLQEREEVSK